MSKYDFELDMKTQNSNSVILNNIKPESTVLEIGCAHGRMTKYLKETLNCIIDIAEIDEEAGKVASQWADHALLGNGGNVELYGFFHGLRNYHGMCLPHTNVRAYGENGFPVWEYDYVIFADVLEHLHDPQKVLEESKQVVKSGGSVWISIPNIAYNGVIIDLINDKFTYRETGLLDNTHLRFFTINSLDKMVKKAGFKIVNEQNLKNHLRNSEFKEAYTQVPPQVASFLKFRPSGEVYQMVWELKVDES